MWVRKSVAEITAENRRGRRGRLQPLSAIVFAALFSFLMLIFDFGGDYVTQPPIALWVALGRVPLRFGVLFAILYTLQLLFGHWWWERHLLICAHCHAIQVPGEPTPCSCGGQFERLDHYKWIEEHPPVDHA
jgi:hypothetical protein